MPAATTTTATFAQRLIAWQKRHGRHDLPWQNTRDPYRVWLSEIMLQQTQVTTVIPYYLRFLARFPDLATLAAAPIDEVMAHWSGLGYYARARNLHACARAVLAEHGGRFPQGPAIIATLPGIGRSTANAIAVFCFGARAAILDGNVKRLLARHAGIEGWPGVPAVESQSWRYAESLLPPAEVATYIQAQMDLGATVCTRSKPKCEQCPVAEDCVAKRDGRTTDLPAAKPRKALPERETTMLIMSEAGQVLLLPRPPSGIWGGLLSLPEIADEQAAPAAARSLGCELVSTEQLPPMTHTFTHFKLRIRPLRCEVRRSSGAHEAGPQWHPWDALDQAPLPAPVRRLLEGAAPDGGS
jgi:A/G-specific adenine glycosylase